MNLTEISYLFRKYAVLFILIIIFLMLLIYTLTLLTQLNSTPSTKVKTKIQINPIFKKIKLAKLKSKTLNKNIDFILDTLNGQPIIASEAASVLSFTKPKPKLSYLEKSYLMAKTAGIDVENITPKRQNEFISFEDDKRKIRINIQNYNFNFQTKTEYLKKVISKLKINVKKENTALEEAQTFLASLDKYPSAIASGKINTIFQQINKNTLKTVEVTERDKANAIRFDFFIQDLGQYPIITENYFNSPNFVVLSFLSEKKVVEDRIEENITPFIVEASMQHRDFDKEGIYPLISGEKAWQILLDKKAIFISVPEQLPDVVKIEKMFLGYLYAPDKTEYLAPYFVFLGKNFIAYVPAISPEYIEN